MAVTTRFLPETLTLFCLLIGFTADGEGQTAALHRSTGGRFISWAIGARAAFAEPIAPPADREEALEEIASVIRRQLDAFKRDNYARAYTFASKAFRAQFSQDRFEAMIRARFPEIARSAATRRGRTFLFMDNTRATLEIDVTGVSARSIAVEYRMVLEEGGWKIDGLALLNPFRHF